MQQNLVENPLREGIRVGTKATMRRKWHNFMAYSLRSRGQGIHGSVSRTARKTGWSSEPHLNFTPRSLMGQRWQMGKTWCQSFHNPLPMWIKGVWRQPQESFKNRNTLRDRDPLLIRLSHRMGRQLFWFLSDKKLEKEGRNYYDHLEQLARI